jgi:protoporphyrinogen/coproporphyrinogen III oxidase
VTDPRVVVVGGGVGGLTTAYRLHTTEPSLDVMVLEAGERTGGKLSAVQVGDLELDAGPDSFVARKPGAIELCRELGIAMRESGASGAYVWTDHGLERLTDTALGVPADLGGLMRWRGMSRRGRLRALADLVIRPAAREEDESIGSLARRRLGDETTEMLIQPLLGGLFAGDIDRLGVRATFPELAEWERDFGGLILGARAAFGNGRSAGPMFLRPAEGVPTLPRALEAALGPGRVRTGHEVTGIRSDGSTFVVRDLEHPADAVVLATPAWASSAILGDLAPLAAAELASIPYVSTGVVLLVYPAGTAEAMPDATGFVVPRGKAPMTATTFVSRKWPSAAFGDRAVVRCFVGGAGAEDLLDEADEDIVDAVCRHLAAVLPLPNRAEASRVVRWPRAMPQYGVGHLERVERIGSSLPPGIVLAGNAYRGVGVADAVRSADRAAEAVLAHLGARRSSERETVA